MNIIISCATRYMSTDQPFKSRVCQFRLMEKARLFKASDTQHNITMSSSKILNKRQTIFSIRNVPHLCQSWRNLKRSFKPRISTDIAEILQNMKTGSQLRIHAKFNILIQTSDNDCITSVPTEQPLVGEVSANLCG
jgi:hypothetical protein